MTDTNVGEAEALRRRVAELEQAAQGRVDAAVDLLDRLAAHEAVVDRLRVVLAADPGRHPGHEHICPDDLRRILAPVLAAAGEGEHVYLSTSCRHGEHGYCSSATGSNGNVEWAKSPGRCKFCPSECVCPCHGEGAGEGR